MFDILRSNLFKILAALLSVLILHVLFSGFREVRALDKSSVVDEPKVHIKQPRADKPVYHDVYKAHLFGEYIPENVDAGGVRESDLNLTVVGILFAEDEKSSRVMFELPGQQVKTFGVGDTLPGGAVIKRITQDGILLMRRGVVERLTLPKNEIPMAPIPEALQLNTDY